MIPASSPTSAPRSRGAFLAVLAAFFLFLGLTGAAAQEPAAEPAGGREAVPTTVDAFELGELDLAEEGETLPLELDSAFAMALERNLGILVERYRRTQSLLGTMEAMGIYDFNLGALVRHTDETTPPVSALTAVGGDGDGEAAELPVLTEESSLAVFEGSQLLPWGGLAGVEFVNFRSESNDLNDFINPLYSVELDFTYVQPLLRNFGRLATERNILRARLAGQQSRDDFEAQVEGVLQLVNDTYWDLVEAREQLAVAEESLSLAQELHEMNRIQVEVGTLAPLELVQSEAGVAARQEDIIRQRAALEDAADELRRLLNFDAGPLWDRPIEPATDAEMPFVEIDVPEAVAIALAERPDVRRQRLEIERLAVDAEFFENQEKPRLDLGARYGWNGVGGDVRVRDPETGEVVVTPGDYGDAVDQLTDRDAEGWVVDLTFAYPLQNRAARARSAIADLALEEGEARLAQLEQQVMTDVRRTARATLTAQQQIESARVSSRLAQRNLEAEQKRYENGLSTSFQVLEIQEDLALARSREVSAVTAYRRALVAYQRSIGRLLDATGFALADPEDERDYADLARR